MDITRNFIKAKRPCAEGFRWYLRHASEEAGYQDLLDALVAAGRVDDACWLLSQFGPTDSVLALDAVDASALVFAGTLQVRGAIEVDTVLRVGRSVRAGGGVRAGRLVEAGDELRCEGALHSGGALCVGGDLRVGWGIEAGSIRCGGGCSGHGSRRNACTSARAAPSSRTA